jgi:hypothetical protein
VRSDAEHGRPADRRPPSWNSATPSSGPDLRPLVARTGGSATQAVYGLILATSVIAASYDASDAAPVALAVLVTAVVFWLAHVYAHMLGRDVSLARGTRAELAGALRDHWSLVEVVMPLVLVLGLGAIGVIPDRTALVAATAVGLFELAAAGGYAAVTRGAGPLGTVISAAIALALGLVVVLLKVLVH